MGNEKEPWVNKTGSQHDFDNDIIFMGLGDWITLSHSPFGLWRPCPWKEMHFKDLGNTTGGPWLQFHNYIIGIM